MTAAASAPHRRCEALRYVPEERWPARKQGGASGREVGNRVPASYPLNQASAECLKRSQREEVGCHWNDEVVAVENYRSVERPDVWPGVIEDVVDADVRAKFAHEVADRGGATEAARLALETLSPEVVQVAFEL